MVGLSLPRRLATKTVGRLGCRKPRFPHVQVMSPQEFENDVHEFNKRVEDLDRRLATILIQAFDDTPDVEHAFKVSASEAEVSVRSPSVLLRGQ